jgi:hypothetical protein
MSSTREGEQSGVAQHVSNRIPLFASASRFGVFSRYFRSNPALSRQIVRKNDNEIRLSRSSEQIVATRQQPPKINDRDFSHESSAN